MDYNATPYGKTIYGLQEIYMSFAQVETVIIKYVSGTKKRKRRRTKRRMKEVKMRRERMRRDRRRRTRRRTTRMKRRDDLLQLYSSLPSLQSHVPSQTNLFKTQCFPV